MPCLPTTTTYFIAPSSDIYILKNPNILSSSPPLLHLASVVIQPGGLKKKEADPSLKTPPAA